MGFEKSVEEIEAELTELRTDRAVFGDLMLPEGPQVPMKRVDELVAKEFAVDEDSLHYHGHRAGTPKAVAVELCCELSGKSQREIAKYYGYKTDSGVTRQRWVIGQKTAEDESLVRQIEKLRRNLVKCKIKV